MPSLDDLMVDYLWIGSRGGRGALPGLRGRIETWQRQALDGRGARELGMDSGEFSIFVCTYLAAEEVDGHIYTLEEKSGTIIAAITDMWEATHQNYAVNLVGDIGRAPVLDGGVAKVRVDAQFQCVKVAADAE